MNIDDEVLDAARVLAEERKVSVGAVMSELARKGLQQTNFEIKRKRGFPVFKTSSRSTPIALERVKDFEDDLRPSFST